MSLFSKIKQGLQKTKENLFDKVDQLTRNFRGIDQELLDELEETLILSDIGIKSATEIINRLKKNTKVKDRDELITALKQIICEILTDNDIDMETDEICDREFQSPKIILLIGVNGTGKTTTAGKLANYYKELGKKVILVAADTFRAAASEQLTIWSERIGVDIIKQKEGSDPSAVIFDAISAAKAREVDILICDTAGRLHNRKNLLEELKKINRIIDREAPNFEKELLLVMDATTGQNGLNQVREFNEISKINGLVLTKIDGTAKGGIVIAIKREFRIPLKFLGVGEKKEDIIEFNAQEFANQFI